MTMYLYVENSLILCFILVILFELSLFSGSCRLWFSLWLRTGCKVSSRQAEVHSESAVSQAACGDCVMIRCEEGPEWVLHLSVSENSYLCIM